MRTLKFQSHGGWVLHEEFPLREAARKAAVEMIMTCHERARIVEVRVHYPVTGETEYLTGYTFDARIPPHGREVIDGDARIMVRHYLDIRQGKA